MKFRLIPLVIASLLGFLLSSAPGQTLTVLYSFTGGTDGYLPASPLIRDAAGNLYGNTFRGGDSTCDRGSSCGVIFKVDANGHESVMYRFTGKADGAYPIGALVLDSSGIIYGATDYGGNLSCDQGYGCGTVFKLDSTTGRLTTLHIFNGTDGASPNGGLALDAAGNIYGTTYAGGSVANSGTVFRIDAFGHYTVLYRFTGKADGKNPLSGVIRDASGNLFGTTYQGGTRYSGSGTVFKLDSSGKETVLHTFIPNEQADGSYPYAAVTPFGEDFYGTTAGGGTGESGTVFKLDKANTETVLYNFLGVTDGSNPQDSPVVLDASGNLYGTTENGGDSNFDGTVFKVDQSGVETVLHRFAGADGSRPMAGVILDSVGNLYGTTFQGGAFGNGTVFKIAP